MSGALVTGAGGGIGLATARRLARRGFQVAVTDVDGEAAERALPDQVAERIEGLLEKPRAVIAIPRWRGAFTRFFDRHPDLTVRLTPLLMRDARRRQARFKKKVEAGEWPPKGS